MMIADSELNVRIILTRGHKAHVLSHSVEFFRSTNNNNNKRKKRPRRRGGIYHDRVIYFSTRAFVVRSIYGTCAFVIVRIAC